MISFDTPMDNDQNSTTSTQLTAIIIARNEEAMIANCIETLRWAEKVVVLDTGSEDHTAELAERAGAEVFHAKGKNFAEWRNEAARKVKTEWILYVDADERVTPALAKVIQSRILRSDYDAYRLRRNNILYGRWLQHGGWGNDWLLRLFRSKKLKEWVGEVHEHAEIVGRVGEIEEPLVHLTHRSVYDGLRKSIEWTDIEARLFLAAKHPIVGPLRLLKVTLFDFLKRVVLKQAWRDGKEGMIEAMIQSMNRFLVYVRLWELQQKPSLPERYQRIEQEIQRQWHGKS